MSMQLAAIDAHVPPKAFGRLVWTEAKMALRIPVGLGLGFAFPIILIVILNAVPVFHKPYNLALTDGGLRADHHRHGPDTYRSDRTARLAR